MKDNTQKPDTKQEPLFVTLMAKYITYWPLFLFFAVLIGASIYSYLRFTNPQYEATASLIIKDEKKGNDDSRIFESLNIINSKKIIENEIDILQSRPILDRVVNKLHLYAPVYAAAGFNEPVLYKDAPFTIEADRPGDLLTSEEKIPVRYNAAEKAVVLDNKLYCPVNQLLKTPYGLLKFIPNESFASDTSTHLVYFSLISKDEAVKDIQNSLKVTATNKLSSVINIKYKDDQPALARDILDEMIAAYNNVNTEEKKNLARNTLKFIEARLNVVGGELNLIENRIQQYKANQGAVDISTQGQLFLQNVSANDQKMSDLNMQLLIINQLEKLIRENDNNIGLMPSSLGLSDPALTQLMNNLNAAELERERLKKTVAENNPILVGITDQINKAKQKIIDHIQSQRSSIQASKENITLTNDSYNTILHSMPVKERELLEISRDKNIKSAIYSFLLQKREESELSLASTLSDSKVVNYAQASDKPVSPNRMLIIGMGILAFLGLPITFINAREALNPNILYRQEIEGLTDIPIIGEVAYNKSGRQLVIEPGKRSFIGEEFRRIRNALLFMGVNGTHKKILVTSGISGEGKSFVAANLAISFSLSGNKVVLVDMDLHNSSLGRVFDKEQQPGVSDYLAGKVDVKDIICQVPDYPNLYFVSSGSVKDIPSELIEDGRVSELLAYLAEHFDKTVIDSEPVELVTDARLLSGACDVTLYVVRHMYSPKMLIKRFDQNNEIGPLKNPGIIFNGVKTRGYIKDNYGYGYGYVYGEKELKRREKRVAKKQVAVA